MMKFLTIIFLFLSYFSYAQGEHITLKISNPVVSDGTLTGDGTSGNNLSVTNPADSMDERISTLNFNQLGNYDFKIGEGGRDPITISMASARTITNASGFDGNLAPTDDTPEEIAQKLDDLPIGDPDQSLILSGGNVVLENDPNSVQMFDHDHTVVDYQNVQNGRFKLIAGSTNGPPIGTSMGAYFPHNSGAYGTLISGRNGDFYMASQENGSFTAWEKLRTVGDGLDVGDNLGNHTATQNVDGANFRFQNIQRVGIGTNNALYGIDCHTDANFQGFLRFFGARIGEYDPNIVLTKGTGRFTWGENAPVTWSRSLGTGFLNSNPQYTVDINGDLHVVQKAIFDDKIGIGVTAPVEKLEILGNAKIRGALNMYTSGNDFYGNFTPTQLFWGSSDNSTQFTLQDNLLNVLTDNVVINVNNDRTLIEGGIKIGDPKDVTITATGNIDYTAADWGNFSRVRYLTSNNINFRSFDPSPGDGAIIFVVNINDPTNVVTLKHKDSGATYAGGKIYIQSGLDFIMPENSVKMLMYDEDIEDDVGLPVGGWMLVE